MHYGREQQKRLPCAWIAQNNEGILSHSSSWTHFDPTEHQPTIEALNPFRNPFHVPLPPVKANNADWILAHSLNPEKVKMSSYEEGVEYLKVYEAQKAAYEAGLYWTAFNPFVDPHTENESDQGSVQEVPPPLTPVSGYEYQNQMNVYIYNPGPLPEGDWIPQQFDSTPSTPAPDPEPAKKPQPQPDEDEDELDWEPYHNFHHKYSDHPHFILDENGNIHGMKSFSQAALKALHARNVRLCREQEKKKRDAEEAAEKAAIEAEKIKDKEWAKARKAEKKALKEAAKALEPPKESWFTAFEPWWATGPKHVKPSRTWQYAQMGV